MVKVKRGVYRLSRESQLCEGVGVWTRKISKGTESIPNVKGRSPSPVFDDRS